MLTKWSVSNFKAIDKTKVVDSEGNEIAKELELKPLTLFCGANSSGKSSFIQSILLLAQTMRHPNKEFPLILNGQFTSLGTFEDVANNKNDNIEIRFSYEPEDAESYIVSNYDYPLNYPIEDDAPDYFFINDASFSLNFINGESILLPKLSEFEVNITYKDISDNPPCYDFKLKYNSELLNSKINNNLKKQLEGSYINYRNESESNENSIDIPNVEMYTPNHFLPENIRANLFHIIV